MRRSRWTRIGILVAALSIAVTACGGGDDDAASGSGTGGGPANKTEDFVIGVSNTLAGNGWREQMICSVKAQALASGKVSKVIAISKNGGPTEQIQDLQNLISQGADAIIVNPSDREKLNPVIEEAALSVTVRLRALSVMLPASPAPQISTSLPPLLTSSERGGRSITLRTAKRAPPISTRE